MLVVARSQCEITSKSPFSKKFYKNLSPDTENVKQCKYANLPDFVAFFPASYKSVSKLPSHGNAAPSEYFMLRRKITINYICYLVTKNSYIMLSRFRIVFNSFIVFFFCLTCPVFIMSFCLTWPVFTPSFCLTYSVFTYSSLLGLPRCLWTFLRWSITSFPIASGSWSGTKRIENLPVTLEKIKMLNKFV